MATSQKKAYKLLRVEKDASQSEISSAYRKASLRVHPDRNPSKKASEEFQELKMANEILSDPETRRKYDQGILDHPWCHEDKIEEIQSLKRNMEEEYKKAEQERVFAREQMRLQKEKELKQREENERKQIEEQQRMQQELFERQQAMLIEQQKQQRLMEEARIKEELRREKERRIREEEEERRRKEEASRNSRRLWPFSGSSHNSAENFSGRNGNHSSHNSSHLGTTDFRPRNVTNEKRDTGNQY